MNPYLFWCQLGVRKQLTNRDISYALAVFACEYVEWDSKQVKDYSLFKEFYINHS